jgi:hypothetical protein
MTSRRAALPALASAFALAWALATVEAAEATSCVDFATALDEAPLVFVGTVVEAAREGRKATFRVEEIWRGHVGRTATVEGGPLTWNLTGAQPQVAIPMSQTYQLWGRYLVAPERGVDGVLRDNVCSATRWFTDDLDGLRPRKVPTYAEYDGGARTISVEAPSPDRARLTESSGGSNGVEEWIVASSRSEAAERCGWLDALVAGRHLSEDGR